MFSLTSLAQNIAIKTNVDADKVHTQLGLYLAQLEIQDNIELDEDALSEDHASFLTECYALGLAAGDFEV